MPVAKKVAKKAAKAPAKKAATPAKKAAPAKEQSNASLIRDAKRLKAGGSNWVEIGQTLGASPGRLQLMVLVADGLKHATPATPAKVRKERDVEGLSWAAIQIRHGIETKSAAQRLYEDGGGNLAAAPVKKAPAKKAATSAKKAAKATKAPTKKAAAAKKGTAKRGGAVPFDPEAPKDDILEAIDGKSITWSTHLGTVNYERVTSGTAKIGKDKSGTRVVVFNDGDKVRTVALSSITKVGR